MIIRAEGSFKNSLIKPAVLRVLTFYSATKRFLREMRAIFIDHRMSAFGVFVEFLNIPIFHLRAKSMFCRYLSGSCVCTVVL